MDAIIGLFRNARSQVNLLFMVSLNHIFKVFGGVMSFFGATGTPVLDFW